MSADYICRQCAHKQGCTPNYPKWATYRASCSVCDHWTEVQKLDSWTPLPTVQEREPVTQSSMNKTTLTINHEGDEAFIVFEKALIKAITDAADGGVSQALIIALLHVHATQQTTFLIEQA